MIKVRFHARLIFSPAMIKFIMKHFNSVNLDIFFYYRWLGALYFLNNTGTKIVLFVLFNTDKHKHRHRKRGDNSNIIGHWNYPGIEIRWRPFYLFIYLIIYLFIYNFFRDHPNPKIIWALKLGKDFF